MSDRALRALKEIVLTFFPKERFRGNYEFTVTAQNDNKVDLRPTSVAEGLSDIPGVPFRSGAPGAKGELQAGTRVLVAFVNGDQSRPFIGWVEGPDGGGFLPLHAVLDAQQTVKIGPSATDHIEVGAVANEVKLGGAEGYVLRDGDMVQILSIPCNAGGTVTFNGPIALHPSMLVAPGPPNAGRTKVKA
jgi:hypothetical protein